MRSLIAASAVVLVLAGCSSASGSPAESSASPSGRSFNGPLAMANDAQMSVSGLDCDSTASVTAAGNKTVHCFGPDQEQVMFSTYDNQAQMDSVVSVIPNGEYVIRGNLWTVQAPKAVADMLVKSFPGKVEQSPIVG